MGPVGWAGRARVWEVWGGEPAVSGGAWLRRVALGYVWEAEGRPRPGGSGGGSPGSLLAESGRSSETLRARTAALSPPDRPQGLQAGSGISRGSRLTTTGPPDPGLGQPSRPAPRRAPPRGQPPGLVLPLSLSFRGTRDLGHPRAPRARLQAPSWSPLPS